MTKLEQMRMWRYQRELPLQRRISELQDKAALAIQRQHALQTSLDMIARMLDSKVLGTMLQQMSNELARELKIRIFEAMAKAKLDDTFCEITLPTRLVHSFDQKSIVSYVMQQYARKYKPRLSLRVPDVEPYYTSIQIDIPPLHVCWNRLTWE